LFTWAPTIAATPCVESVARVVG